MISSHDNTHVNIWQTGVEYLCNWNGCVLLTISTAGLVLPLILVICLKSNSQQVLEPRTQSQTSAPPTLLAEADLQKKAWWPHSVWWFWNSWGGLSSRTSFKRSLDKVSSFSVFSPSNYTCFYLWLPVQRPRYHFPAIKPDTSFPEVCQMQRGTLHLGEIRLAWEPKNSWEAEPQKEATFRCTDLADLQWNINQTSAPYSQVAGWDIWLSSWQAKVMTNFALGFKICSVTIWV